MAKTIEEMVKDVEEKNSFYTRDHNGYCGMHIDETFPSSGKTAIAYQTAGSNWNRGAPSSSGISYFQGTGVYNGRVDLVVKPHCQWRSGTSYANDCPGNRYSVLSFRDLEDGSYELVLRNKYGHEVVRVNFDNGKVENDYAAGKKLDKPEALNGGEKDGRKI